MNPPDPAFARKPSLIGSERAARLDQAQVRKLRARGGHDAQQHVDSLARDGAADVENFGHAGIGGAEQTRGSGVGGFIGARRTGGMHAVGNYHETVGRNHRVGDERVARGDAVAANARRLAHPGEGPPRHHAKRQRAPLGAGSEQATERVEVVAGHDGARARKLVHEMSVAVVDDVEDVEAAAQAPQRARVIEEAVERAVSVETCGVETSRMRARARRRRGSGGGRRRAGCASTLERGRMARLKLRAKHLADQVHAGPALFGVIADHG